MEENTLCECGKPVKHVRTGECGTCYQRRWYREKRSPNATGEVHSVYPLPTVGYTGAHRRVYTARGKANLYPCAAECGAQAQEWSYTPGSEQEQTGLVRYKGRLGQDAVTATAWSPDPDDYEPLCKACHERKDHAE